MSTFLYVISILSGIVGVLLAFNMSIFIGSSVIGLAILIFIGATIVYNQEEANKIARQAQTKVTDENS